MANLRCPSNKQKIGVYSVHIYVYIYLYIDMCIRKCVVDMCIYNYMNIYISLAMANNWNIFNCPTARAPRSVDR